MQVIFSWPVFCGLVLKVALALLVSSQPINLWYAPFMQSGLAELSIFPWQNWLDSGGASEAFPYGYAMWFMFLPAAVLSLVGLPIELGYSFTLLIADIFILFSLVVASGYATKTIIWTYWLSPITVIASYVYGLNDVIPSCFLVFSILALQNGRFKVSGAMVALAISAKLSMLLALPFLFLYLYNNQNFKNFLREFFKGVYIVGGPLLILQFATSAGRKMVFGNPELNKITNLEILLDYGIAIYILPLAYILSVYMFWRVKRTNFDMLVASIAISFLLIVLLTPASPGWFVWALPYLALVVVRTGRLTAIIVTCFSVFYIASVMFKIPIYITDQSDITVGLKTEHPGENYLHYLSMLQTVLTASGIVLIIRIWREVFQKSYFYLASRNSIKIGIAGDSGTGKDTLVRDLISILGKHSCTNLSGDEYHVWDRRSPVWGAISHLNPAANDLERLSNDLLALTNNRNAYVRHYDHTVGRFTKPLLVRPNNIIFVSGLHALYQELTRSIYDLKVYLDMDEELRRFLKTQRDTQVRGHSYEKVIASIKKREQDALRFIYPQKQYADVIIRIEPLDRAQLKDFPSDHVPALQVTVESVKANNYMALNRVLVGVLGLHVTLTRKTNNIGIKITVDGNPSKEDIQMAAKSLFIQEIDFLDIEPKWSSGINGIVQLIMFSEISRALTQRTIR
jgi:uridine kinase